MVSMHPCRLALINAHLEEQCRKRQGDIMLGHKVSIGEWLKRYSDEDALKILRKIEAHLHDGLDVVSACRKAGISDKTYYYWRKKFGGMGRPQLVEMRALQKENDRLKKIVADLQLDRMILEESLDHLKPQA